MGKVSFNCGELVKLPPLSPPLQIEIEIEIHIYIEV